MISSIVIAHLLGKYENSSDAAVAFIYFRYDLKQDKLTPLAVIGNILKQLAVQKNDVRKSLQSLYEKHKEKKTDPSLKELCDILERDATRFKSIFVVLDALDESPESTRPLLSDISKIPNLKLMITGRHHVENWITLLSKVSAFVDLNIRARDDDILKFVRAEALRAVELVTFIEADPFLPDKIASRIVRNAKGMYFLKISILPEANGKVFIGATAVETRNWSTDLTRHFVGIGKITHDSRRNAWKCA